MTTACRRRLVGAVFLICMTSNGVSAAADRAFQFVGQVASPISAIIGKPYGAARKALVAAGWQPVENPSADDLHFLSRQLHEVGYIEVVTCSPVGLATRHFYFTNAQQQYLKVMMRGEDPQVEAVSLLNAVTFKRFANQ